jgi:hypothetical protein
MTKNIYILKRSNRKNKRFVIDMGEHSHHFGSDVGKTYIDHQDDKKKENWIARHRLDKNWDNIHSGIYHSRYLLWTKPTLKQSIKDYEKKHNIRIKLQ